MCDLLKKLQRKHNACAYALVCLKQVRESKLNTNIHSNLTQDIASIKHKHLAGAAQKKEKRRVEGEKKRNKREVTSIHETDFLYSSKGMYDIYQQAINHERDFSAEESKA